MPYDRPTPDEMRLALQRDQATIEPTPQSAFASGVGTVGGYIDEAGKFVSEATKPIAQSHPVRSWIAEHLIAAPLRGAGTALQDWSGTPREVTKERPYTPGPFYGGSPMTLNPQTWGPALQTFKTDPRVLDVAVTAPVASSAARALGREVAVPAARMAAEVAHNRMLAGESLVPGLPQALAPNPGMFVVEPKGNLNFRPAISPDKLKGAEQQSVQSFLQQVKNLPGVTKEGLSSSLGELESLDPSTKITKQKFVNSFSPSEFDKVDLKNAATSNVHALQEAQEYITNHYRQIYESVADRLGLNRAHFEDLYSYAEGSDISDLHTDVQAILKKNKMSPDDLASLTEESTYELLNEYLNRIQGNYGTDGKVYQYADSQRLVDSKKGDILPGYFEFGITHPNGPSSYKHYDAAPEGTIGHVRGTFLDDFMNSSPEAEVRALPNPKPNSMLIEEIQSDANKVADQTGPLHQIHGTLFKAAVQHALENGADTIYLPTAKTIAEARSMSPSKFASIYDRQVIKEGLNPLKSIEGVSVNPIEDAYHEINISPEAKEQILNGSGQKTPGYANGGLIQFSKDSDSMRYELMRNT